MDRNTWMQQVSALKLLNSCKDEYKWKELSSDWIMDVGCGVNGLGGIILHEMFPGVENIIGITKDPEEARNLSLKKTTKIKYVVADIEKRDSLRNYEGQLNKVISIQVFDQILEKEEAFRNIYYLLKPGGQAAVLFTIKSSIYEWLTEMLNKPRWKDAYQGHYIEDLYKNELGAAEYKKMVRKIGFQSVKVYNEEREIIYLSEQVCKEALYQKYGKYFNIPPELLEEFKDESFQDYLKLIARDEEGKPCFRSTEMHILLTKPTDSSASETKDNIGS